MMNFWRGFSPIILYGWSVTLQAGGISSTCGKNSHQSPFPKNRRKHFGHLCFCLADGYLNTVCCCIKIWNPKKNRTKLEQKHTEVVLVRGVSKRRSLWGGDFNRGGSFQVYCYMYKKLAPWKHITGVYTPIISIYFHIIGDGHQPNGRGLYTH